MIDPTLCRLPEIKRLLVTGGSGSLGTAFVARARVEGWSDKITILARGETKINQVRREFPEVRCEIGDVRDLKWLNTIVPGHSHIVHAAAIKVVPTAELNSREAVLTNVQGSMNLAMAAVEAGVERVVGISTDKACVPTTTYGATKMLMESLFREANNWSLDTSFVSVRYGNVLRSNNSVIPLFEKQIVADEPFTITDGEMTRFWIPMNQALNLIYYALGIDEGGLVIVPRPPAMSMLDLASALDPNREVVYVGVRPGEKLHETLLHGMESSHTFLWNGCYHIRPPGTKLRGQYLGFGVEYTSQDPSYWLDKEMLYEWLDTYNPYGGPQWVVKVSPKS